MNMTDIRLFLILGLLVLCSCSKAPQLAALPPDAVVLAFGDSITFGSGAAPGESYPAVLEGLIGRRVVNAGVPGETTAQGRARLAAALDEQRPALLLLCLGGNDFLQHQDESRTDDNLRAMVALAQERGVAVVLIAVPRLGFGLEVPKLYEKIAKDSSIPLERKVLKKILSTGSLKSDLIHPNAAGYRILAESVARLIGAAGALNG
ncbi:MAG: arylesterase [Geobacter sp.]|nr:arylesterase [Geobacter sp.]